MHPNPEVPRTESDIVAIGNLCKLAGVEPSSYLTKKITATSSHRYLTVAEISNELAENRSAEGNRTAIMNSIDVNHSGGGRAAMDRLQADATAFARTNARTPTANLYVEGTRKGTTPEQAFAMGLEQNPEAYSAYREKHNAAALIATLQRAGVKISG